MSDEDETKKCAGCLNDITSDRRSMRCFLCEKYYDLSCCGLSDIQYKKLNKTTKTTWKCPTCQARLRSGGDNSNTPIRTTIKPAAGDEQSDMDAYILESANKIISSSLETVIHDVLTKELKPIKTDLALLNDIKCSIKYVSSELEDIKKSLTHLKEENKKMSKENEELKTRVKEHSTRLSGQDTKIIKIKEEIKEISNKNREIERSMEFTANQYDGINNKMKAVEDDSKAYTHKIQQLSDTIEDLERQARQSKVELRNVPNQASESQDDLINIARSLYESIKLPFSVESIQNIYKLPGKPDKPRVILIELRSVLLKEKLLKAVKSHNAQNKDNMLNSSHVGLSGPAKPIYVADYLSSKTKKLYFLARETAKEKNFKYCWTKNGKVFMKKDDGAKLILIKEESQIEELKKMAE